MIASTHNSRIKQIRALLSRRQEREKRSAFVAEGVRLVEDALAAGWLPEWALYSPQVSRRGMQIVKDLLSRCIPVDEVAPELMSSISATETPQGLLAVFAARSLPLPEKLDFILILDSLRDPGNLGTILRSAAAAGADLIMLTHGCADPWSPKTLRGGMGAHFRLPLQARIGWPEIAQRATGMQIWVADPQGDKPYDQVNWNRRCVLIIGGETAGLSSEAICLATGRLGIPMCNQVDSLNAAMAATVVLFEAARQRRRSRSDD
jgi:TrmH family RNA methyltransferase